MQHRASIVLLFAMAAGVSGYTQQRTHPISRGDISGTGELVGTWRLISRVVGLEDGCPSPKQYPRPNHSGSSSKKASDR